MAKNEVQVQRLLKRQSVAFLIAAMIASFCLVLVGFLIESTSEIASRAVIVLGSSGLGTCFGLVFGSISGSSALARVASLVDTAFSSAIRSTEVELSPFRQVWHHYICTRSGDSIVWRYRQIDFSRFFPSDRLIATFDVPGPDGGSHNYYVEAYLVASRLVVVQKASAGSEEPVIGLYPCANQRFRSIVAGVNYLQTWNGEQTLMPAMMSTTPLVGPATKKAIGTLSPDTYQQLNDKWSAEAATLGLVNLESRLPDGQAPRVENGNIPQESQGGNS